MADRNIFRQRKLHGDYPYRRVQDASWRSLTIPHLMCTWWKKTPSWLQLQPGRPGTSIFTHHIALRLCLRLRCPVQTFEIQTQMQAQGNGKFSISCVDACVCVCAEVVHACVFLCLPLHLRRSYEPASSFLLSRGLQNQIPSNRTEIDTIMHLRQVDVAHTCFDWRWETEVKEAMQSKNNPTKRCCYRRVGSLARGHSP